MTKKEMESAIKSWKQHSDHWQAKYEELERKVQKRITAIIDGYEDEIGEDNLEVSKLQSHIQELEQEVFQLEKNFNNEQEAVGHYINIIGEKNQKIDKLTEQKRESDHKVIYLESVKEKNTKEILDWEKQYKGISDHLVSMKKILATEGLV